MTRTGLARRPPAVPRRIAEPDMQPSESFLAVEVSRVLAPGGSFVTQQVDYHDNEDLAQILGIETPEEPDSSAFGGPSGRSPRRDWRSSESARADQRVRFDDIRRSSSST